MLSLLPFICTILYVASHVAGIVLPRQNGAPDPGDATNPTDPGVQTVPLTGKAPNTFSNGQAEQTGGFPYDSGPIPDLYQPREIDIPFGRMFHGDLMMFPQGQLNNPNFNTDEWTPNQYDFANQSACGIPDNSYLQMKVAIHPYFLKYAGLDRESSIPSPYNTACLNSRSPSITHHLALTRPFTDSNLPPFSRLLHARRLRIFLARRRLH